MFGVYYLYSMINLPLLVEICCGSNVLQAANTRFPLGLSYLVVKPESQDRMLPFLFIP